MIHEWLEEYRLNRLVPDNAYVTAVGAWDNEDPLLADIAFNSHAKNDGSHVSPYDTKTIQVGVDGIQVRLLQGIDEESFKRVVSRATRATTGLPTPQGGEHQEDWEEMMGGGLQSALETQVVVFEVWGASRALTHQLVRSRRAGFHQQSQRATWYGDSPEVRMPESIWRNPNPSVRTAWVDAVKASWYAYRVACDAGVSYQDARYILGEGTVNYIQCEYTVREFLNVYAYRACSMFLWEMVHTMRAMGSLLAEAHPMLAPYIKISCEKGPEADRKCTFQGWENPEGQCSFPWARQNNRTFLPSPKYRIGTK